MNDHDIINAIGDRRLYAYEVQRILGYEGKELPLILRRLKDEGRLLHERSGIWKLSLSEKLRRTGKFTEEELATSWNSPRDIPAPSYATPKCGLFGPAR